MTGPSQRDGTMIPRLITVAAPIGILPTAERGS
jgi:hypothetical protein